ncbi:hypothetical protein, partial [Bartonella sp. CL63NXGY]|uniref:hypothetical protein n=1 Tax=Bartonella sp. CL63NXGY TaxID=3243538 RepID=UPI0035CF626C
LLATLLIIVASIGGIHAKMEKHVADWLGVNRLLILILLIVIIVQTVTSFPQMLIWHILWIFFIAILYSLMEVVFREKMETFGNPRHAHLLIAG